MITRYRGRWDVDKRASAWRYLIQLACSMCGKETGFVGDCVEGTSPDVGTWRRVAPPNRGHDDPLAEDAVVCGRVCAESFVAGALDRLFA